MATEAQVWEVSREEGAAVDGLWEAARECAQQEVGDCTPCYLLSFLIWNLHKSHVN